MKVQCQFGRNLTLALLAVGMSVGTCLAAAPVQDDLKPRKVGQAAPQDAPIEAPKADPSLPAADEIIKRAIEAAGGESAIRAHNYRHLKGDFGIPSFEINGTFELHQAAPHFFLLSLDIAGIGKSVHGYNGETGWTNDDNQGPTLHEGDMLEEVKREADFYSDLNFDKHFPKRETVSKEEFNGTMCYKLHLQSPNGSDFENFYSVDTGLAVGMKGTATTPQGKLATVTTMEDYKTVDGVKIPHKLSVTYPEMRMTQVMTIKEVSHGEFDKGVFALPREIQTLLEIKKEEAASGRDNGEGDAPGDDDGADDAGGTDAED